LHETKIIELFANNLEAAFADALIEAKEIAIYNEKNNEINCIQNEAENLKQIHSLLFNNISDGIIIFDLDGIIVDCNPAVEKLIGHNKEHIINTRLRNYVHPEDSLIGEQIQSCAKTKEKYYSEIRLINGNNKIIDCEIKVESYCSESGQMLAVLSLLRDITQRKITERALLASENKWRQLVETANEGIWQIDANSNTTFVNQKMADMLGYTVAEMIGKSVLDFVGDEKEDMENNVDRRKQGIIEQHDFTFKRKNNSELFCIISTNPIFAENGDYEGALGMITDISDRKLIKI
jgi:PAS domain S-box-containing protein